MNSITQDIKYRLLIIKYAQNHDVTKATIKHNKNRQFIYRLLRRYDGTRESLKPKSCRQHSQPKEHTAAEIKLIKDMRRRNPYDELVIFWVKLNIVGDAACIGEKMYQYTAIDECTRYRYIAAFKDQSTYSSTKFLQQLKKKFPFRIFKIQTMALNSQIILEKANHQN